MNILEIAILEQEEGLFRKFSQEIPLQVLTEYDFPVYRLEIDPNLILIFYIFDVQKRFPVNFLENIFPSLKRIIWLSSEQNFNDLIPPDEFKELFEQFEDAIPSAVILGVEDEKMTLMSEVLLHQGCYLGDQSRLYLWNEGDPQSSRQLWQLIWSVHETATEVAEIPEVQQ